MAFRKISFKGSPTPPIEGVRVPPLEVHPSSVLRSPVFPSAAAVPPRPTAEQIRVRAFEIYCARNGIGGDPVSDWCRAERELMGEALGPVGVNS